MTREQLLASLAPNLLPKAVGFWPLAIGWYGLLGIFFLLVIVVGYYLARRSKNQYRRNAIAKVKKQLALFDPENTVEFLRNTNRILKSLALKDYPSTPIAALSGKKWHDFLLKSTNKELDPESLEFLTSYYQRQPIQNLPAEKVCQTAITWIRSHHV